MPSVTLTTDTGASFSAYLALAAQPNGAGVVVLQEIFGVNVNMRKTADALAAAGFAAIVPDLFWRQQPSVELDPASDRERATELMKGLDVELAINDALVAADYLRGLDGANGKVGAVGYCLGGKLAWLMAMQPGIDAAASYYGVAIQASLDRMSDVRAPLILHIAEQDPLCPPDAQAAIAEVAAENPHVTILTYPNVGHAFARHDSPARDEASAARADAATVELLTAHLVGAA